MLRGDVKVKERLEQCCGVLGNCVEQTLQAKNSCSGRSFAAAVNEYFLLRLVQINVPQRPPALAFPFVSPQSLLEIDQKLRRWRFQTCAGTGLSRMNTSSDTKANYCPTWKCYFCQWGRQRCEVTITSQQKWLCFTTMNAVSQRRCTQQTNSTFPHFSAPETSLSTGLTELWKFFFAVLYTAYVLPFHRKCGESRHLEMLNASTFRRTHTFALWRDIHIIGTEKKLTFSLVQAHASVKCNSTT